MPGNGDLPPRINNHARSRDDLASSGAGLKVGLITVIAVAAGLALGAALWAGSDEDGDGDPAAVGAGDLFVVDGRLASARSTGQGTLEVDVKDATVLWFSDRPARLNGNRPIGEFVAEWPSTFGGDPPNAAVLAQHSRHPIGVELQRPSIDRSRHVARFELRPEPGSGDRASAWLAKLDRTPRSELGRLVLFVDNGGPLPGPQPSPSPEVTTAYTKGMAAIETLQAVAASGGSLSATAAADLEELQQAAAER
jgi:hypothetical protein